MFIITLLFVFVLLYKVRFAGFRGYFDDYLSIKSTNAIKGIMALSIVLHHLCRQFADSGNYQVWLKPFDSPMGWLLVSVFFFFSGYGLMVGYLNKPDYLKGFLLKRLPSVLFPLFTATILYLPFQLIINKENLNITYLFDILTGREFIVCNCWYVYSIIIFYVLFFAIFKLIKNPKLAILIFTISICLYEIACFILYNAFFWSASSITIVLGVVFAYKYEPITEFIKKFYYFLLPAVIIGYVGSMAINPVFNRLFHFYPPEFIPENFCCLFFVLFLLIVSLKLKFANIFTTFLGSISYEMYLLHGLFMIIFTDFIKIENSIIYVFLVIALTIASSFLIQKLNRMIYKKYSEHILHRK